MRRREMDRYYQAQVEFYVASTNRRDVLLPAFQALSSQRERSHSVLMSTRSRKVLYGTSTENLAASETRARTLNLTRAAEEDSKLLMLYRSTVHLQYHVHSPLNYRKQVSISETLHRLAWLARRVEKHNIFSQFLSPLNVNIESMMLYYRLHTSLSPYNRSACMMMRIVRTQRVEGGGVEFEAGTEGVASRAELVLKCQAYCCSLHRLQPSFPFKACCILQFMMLL